MRPSEHYPAIGRRVASGQHHQHPRSATNSKGHPFANASESPTFCAFGWIWRPHRTHSSSRIAVHGLRRLGAARMSHGNACRQRNDRRFDPPFGFVSHLANSIPRRRNWRVSSGIWRGKASDYRLTGTPPDVTVAHALFPLAERGGDIGCLFDECAGAATSGARP